MHLSDQELLELDASAKLHLNGCEHCQQKAENLRKMRIKFSQLPANSMMKSNWQQTKQAYLFELKVKESEKAKQNLIFWRSSSFALAASLLLVVLWQFGLGTNPAPVHSTTQLETLIAHNQMLQKEFAQIEQASFNDVNFIELQHELSLVDFALQQAYEQKAEDEEKAKLWQKRHKLMKQMLQAREKRKVMVI